MTRCAKNHRPGMALLVVVVLTMLIALAAYRFSFYMESQYRLTRLHEEQVHAKLAALSGIELAASMAELPVVERASLGGVFDNPAMLRHVAVDGQTDASSRTEQVSTSWRFGLLSPRAALSSSNASGGSSSGTGSVGTDSGQSDHLRFGFENESAKLHLPTLLEWDRKSPGHARATLLALPGATESLVDAWLRGLGVKKRGQGANGESALLDRLESSSQDSEQRSSTDPLKTLWFGGDFNQNYQLEPLELRLSEQLFSRQVTGSRAAILTTAQPLHGNAL